MYQIYRPFFLGLVILKIVEVYQKLINNNLIIVYFFIRWQAARVIATIDLYSDCNACNREP